MIAPSFFIQSFSTEEQKTNSGIPGIKYDSRAPCTQHGLTSFCNLTNFRTQRKQKKLKIVDKLKRQTKELKEQLTLTMVSPRPFKSCLFSNVMTDVLRPKTSSHVNRTAPAYFGTTTVVKHISQQKNSELQMMLYSQLTPSHPSPLLDRCQTNQKNPIQHFKPYSTAQAMKQDEHDTKISVAGSPKRVKSCKISKLIFPASEKHQADALSIIRNLLTNSKPQFITPSQQPVKTLMTFQPESLLQQLLKVEVLVTSRSKEAPQSHRSSSPLKPAQQHSKCDQLIAKLSKCRSVTCNKFRKQNSATPKPQQQTFFLGQQNFELYQEQQFQPVDSELNPVKKPQLPSPVRKHDYLPQTLEEFLKSQKRNKDPHNSNVIYLPIAISASPIKTPYSSIYCTNKNSKMEELEPCIPKLEFTLNTPPILKAIQFNKIQTLTPSKAILRQKITHYRMECRQYAQQLKPPTFKKITPPTRHIAYDQELLEQRKQAHEVTKQDLSKILKQHFSSNVEEKTMTMSMQPRKQFSPLTSDKKILKLFDPSRFNTFNSLNS